ncbi:MAG: PhoH family protein [Bacteroidetes bacterium]|nr:PhoH family protein [Bacteroidota bacterium]
MSEVIIPIDTFNPVEFFGVNDSNLEVIRRNFPELKLVARGNEIKVIGDEKNIHLFSEKINRLIQHYQKFGSLTPDNVEHFLADKNGKEGGPPAPPTDVLVFGQNAIMVRARTVNQKKLVESSEKNDVVFAIGPAGTGKTYTAVALAVRALKNREIKRIILTRPAVEAGENLGFLPGDLKEKIDPYLRPLYDALYDMIQGEKVKNYVENGIIEVAPLAFMRGRTLDNAFVILDEAQNATESQLKMFLTRMGPSAKFIVTGDVTQIDLPRNQPSGLIQAIKILSNIKGMDFIYLDAQDVVRHRLVKEIIEAYNK